MINMLYVELPFKEYVVNVTIYLYSTDGFMFIVRDSECRS